MRSLFSLGEASGKRQFVLPVSDAVYARVLAAGVAETIAVPANANVVVFSATAAFFVDYDATAVVPSGDIDATAPELNPGARRITGIANLSIISATAGAVVVASFYVCEY